MGLVLDPQQELFTRAKIDMEAAGFAVYDGFLPPDGTPYPFVYLGDCQQVDDANKSAVFGNVYLTIHVWSNTPKNRGTVSQMLLDIKSICRKIEHTANYSWTLRNVNQRILSDSTTKTPLLHGVLEVEFHFS
ncbi:MAG: DUF3168 domain-containing protein [Eubacteriales bacterium]